MAAERLDSMDVLLHALVYVFPVYLGFPVPLSEFKRHSAFQSAMYLAYPL